MAFKDLKEYLNVLPFLVSPELGETLYLYVIASNKSLAVVLIRETPKGQFPMYYVSMALHSLEFNYKRIEKLAYALIMAFRKLR